MNIEQTLPQRGSVFFDTAPLIYLIESHDVYGPIMKQIGQYISKNKICSVTSVITISEVLPKPISQNLTGVVEKFLKFLKEKDNMVLVDINAEIAELAGRLRGKYNSLKTLDALQIAAACHSGVDAFITNDIKLKQINEVRVVILADYVRL